MFNLPMETAALPGVPAMQTPGFLSKFGNAQPALCLEAPPLQFLTAV